MINDRIQAEYNRWIDNTTDDILDELSAMSEMDIEDAFYRELSFGTGGLRGTIGAGTNRMNEYVVAKVSQGLSSYLLSENDGREKIVVIGYDSRIKSDVFANVAASVFSANGIRVYIWSELLPVPTVSFAVRTLLASAGVMITASHNPCNYNGYKVYGPDGCQITAETADRIFSEIKKTDFFSGVKKMPLYSAKAHGILETIDNDVLTSFIEAVKNQSVLFGEKIKRDIAIVYSPLNGTGLKPVTRVLIESGFTNITVVEEQRNPDGNFPTCPYPNPEIREAMLLGLQYCERMGADLLLATDPDCDRCGVAVRNRIGEYQLLSGNEVGLLLLDYICAQRVKHNKMPTHPVFVKTIVTTDLAEKIANSYGVKTINTLTGFKFIGEVINGLEVQDKTDEFIFAFEESYGYLTGSYVRDKDAVNAVFMICEMFAYYKTQGFSLLDKLDKLYKTYGYCLQTLHSYEFSGLAGMNKISSSMKILREGLDSIGGEKIIRTEDYIEGLNGLPKADVIKFVTETGSVVIRPSGTEPKLKIYISVLMSDRNIAKKVENLILSELMLKLGEANNL